MPAAAGPGGVSGNRAGTPPRTSQPLGEDVVYHPVSAVHVEAHAGIQEEAALYHLDSRWLAHPAEPQEP